MIGVPTRSFQKLLELFTSLFSSFSHPANSPNAIPEVGQQPRRLFPRRLPMHDDLSSQQGGQLRASPQR